MLSPTIASHAMIVARSLGVPILIAKSNVLDLVKQSDILIMDAIKGYLIVNPTLDEIKKIGIDRRNFFKILLNLIVEEGLDLNYKYAVVGVGGAGIAIVSSFFRKKLGNFKAIIVNSDKQELDFMPADEKVFVELKKSGLILFNESRIIEKLEKSKELNKLIKELKNYKKTFIISALGGLTGTTIGPYLFERLKRKAIAIFIVPFKMEGTRIKKAEKIIEKFGKKKNVFFIKNDRLLELFGDLTIKEAFENCNNLIYEAINGYIETKQLKIIRLTLKPLIA